MALLVKIYGKLAKYWQKWKKAEKASFFIVLILILCRRVRIPFQKTVWNHWPSLLMTPPISTNFVTKTTIHCIIIQVDSSTDPLEVWEKLSNLKKARHCNEKRIKWNHRRLIELFDSIKNCRIHGVWYTWMQLNGTKTNWRNYAATFG